MDEISIATVEKSLDYGMAQYRAMTVEMEAHPRKFPRAMKDGRLVTVGSWWWTTGFYPASLWLLYEYSGEESFRSEARRRTNLLKIQRWNRFTHDLGFMLFLPFGAAYRIEKDQRDLEVLLRGARSLASRFNPRVGLIRSWNHWKWRYPVIIDNMMNLNYLFWASEHGGDASYRKMAVSHADKTIRNHFREDGSTYHVVDYHPRTGAVLSRGTCQGYADESVWSRGQAWAVYGYTEMYRNTKNEVYLDQARTAAGFILNHPSLPDDGIPFWDLSDPAIPDAPRDVSSAAILASGLLELQGYAGGTEAAKYLSAADKILNTLAGGEYRSPKRAAGCFILGSSVGNLPGNEEVDTPLTYGDYYYIEALLRRLDVFG